MLDVLKMLYPPPPPPGAAKAAEAAEAGRLLAPASRGRVRPRGEEPTASTVAVKEEEEEVRAVEWAGAKEEAEEVKILHLVERAGDAAGPAAAGGGKRRRVNGEEGAGLSWRGVAGRSLPGAAGEGVEVPGRQQGEGEECQALDGADLRHRGRQAFRGVYKDKRAKAKPWTAQIEVTEDGMNQFVFIGSFSREEDAARACDRVSIAKLGPAEATTNFPVADYRAEWAELKELGVDGAVAAERKKKDRSDPPEPPSKRRRVTEKTQSKLTAFFGLGAVGGKGGFRLHL